MSIRGTCQYKGQTFYQLKIDNLERRLPIVKIDKNTRIASFIMLGDVQLVEHCASKLVEKLRPGFDILAVPEAKAIPLAHSIAQKISKPPNYMHYCVIRKSRKGYFGKTMSAAVRSITTNRQQRLYLDKEDVEKIRGKSVCLIDDVISTGSTIHSCLDLIKRAGGTIHQIAVVLLEGSSCVKEFNLHKTRPLIYLGRIPLYVDSNTKGK